MPEKVIRGNWIDRKTHDEVEVPSWEEFCGERDNKGYLWWVVNQLKSNPSGDDDPVAAVRKIYDDIRELERNVWKKKPGEDRYTLWDCINALERHVWKKDGGEVQPPILDRLNGVEKKLADLPNIVAECFRTAIQGELQPLLDSAKANIDSLLNDNCDLKDKISSLSDTLGKHGDCLETLEKQIRELPDKARAVLLGNILAELQPQLDSAKADIASLQSANDELKNGIDSLHTELSSCQTNLKQGLASSQEANSSLKQEINSLCSELSSCQTGLKQELASAQEANSKLKAEIDSLRTELSTCQTGLKQELASTQEANSKLETEIASLHTELSTCQANLKQEVTSSLEASTRLEAEINSLRAELSTCQANLDAHLNPPKKQGFFKRLYFRMLKFFRSKTFSDTNTPPPQGS